MNTKKQVCPKCQVKRVGNDYIYCFDCNICPYCDDNRRLTKEYPEKCYHCSVTYCEQCETNTVGDGYTVCWECNNIVTCRQCFKNDHNIKFDSCKKCFDEVECTICKLRSHNKCFDSCRLCNLKKKYCISIGCSRTMPMEVIDEYCRKCTSEYSKGRHICETKRCNSYIPTKFPLCKCCQDKRVCSDYSFDSD